MKIFSKTDIGLLRDENQDCVWSASLSDGACAAVLCDGMGGEAHGGLASRIAVDVISKRILGTFSEMMNRNSVRNLLITAVSAANSSVVDVCGNLSRCAFKLLLNSDLIIHRCPSFPSPEPPQAIFRRSVKAHAPWK